MRYGYQTDTWSVDEGLPQNSNQRVLATLEGSVWVSGFGTPARFDGYTFAPVPLRGVPSRHSVPGHGIMPCPTGGICAVVPGDGVWRVVGDSLAQRIVALDAQHYARDVYRDALLIGAYAPGGDGIYLVTADSAARLSDHPPDGIDREDVLTLGADGTLYVHSQRGDIWARADGGSWQRHSSALVGLRVTLLSNDTAGDAWVLGEAGIHRITEDGLELFADIPWSRHLLRYRDGYLSAGRSGIHRLNSDGSVRDTLTTAHANWLYVGANGTIWAALEAEGVIRIHPHRIGHIDLGAFGQSGVRSLLRARDGSAWATGNCEGVLRFTPGGQHTRYAPSDEPLSVARKAVISDCLWSVAQDGDGRVWTSGMGGRLHVIERGAIRLVDSTPDPSGWMLRGGTTALFTDRDGALWMGRRQDRRIYRRSRSGEFVHVPTRYPPDGADLAEALVLQFFQAEDGAIWAGGPGYASRFDGAAFVPVLRVEDAVRTFAQSRDGTMYVGTYGGGIYRLSTDMQQRAAQRAQQHPVEAREVPRLRQSDGLPDDFVSFLHIDANDRLWSTHNQGLARTHLRALDAYLDDPDTAKPPHTRTFTAADGLPSTEFNGGFQGAGLVWDDGTVWLPTLKGLAVLDPDRADDAQEPPSPFIRSVQIDGTEVPCASQARCPVSLSASARRIRFEVGALAMEGTRSIQTEVLLTPHTPDWERLDASSRAITYAALPGGTYMLDVRTRSADGTWGLPRTLATVIVATPFYRSVWFWSLLAGLSLATLVLGIRARDRALLQRADRLQRAIDQRTSELRVAAARLEAQNAALLDLVASKERVMRMVSHDLKSPIGGIVGLAEAVEEELPPASEAGEMVSLIREAGEQSLTLIHAILNAEHSTTFDEKDLPAVDLRSVVSDSLRLAQGFARTKRQRIHTDLAEAPLAVRADALRLRLVVDNLVSNALKYAPPDSDIRVRASRDETWAVLTVDDAGPGISPEQWPRVFDPYTLLGAKPTGKETATGLGLFLAREIVHQYGGTIHVAGSVQGGARFTVRLPLVGSATAR